jgi:lipoate-protein ligase A
LRLPWIVIARITHLMSNWRILPLTIADQQQHIDQSEALLAAASADGQPTLYWSMADPPALVLGFSQKPDIINPQALATLNIPIYHRRAGGTAVLTGPNLLSLDIILPPEHPLVLPDVIESYRWFGEAWVATLAQLGIQARTVPPDEAHEQRTLLKRDAERESILQRACYATLSPYEVVIGQRKIVGLDMRRRRIGTLLQAGLLLHWETITLAQLLGHNPAEQTLLRTALPERAIGLNTLLTHTITPNEIITAFENVLLRSENHQM